MIVPDEQTWTVAGADPAALGLRPTFAPGQARRVLLSDQVPEALADALAEWMTELPAGMTIEERHLRGLPGEPPRAGRHPARTHEAAEHEHEHEHHDMMAIIGEPSADGLVMEPIELRFGPLGTPLPAGLVLDVTLDGDVVDEASIEASLERSDPPTVVPGTPDLLAPLAWRTALDAASAPPTEPHRWIGIAAIEVERAVSHLAWLRSLGRLLEWPPLIDRCTQALSAISGPHGQLSAPPGSTQKPTANALDPGMRATRRAMSLVTDSRWLRLRTGDRARVTAEQVREHGLRGPIARASGVDDDSRSNHALYKRLGFSPVLMHEGDAFARTRVRVEEADMALTLAAGALRAAAARAPADATPGEDPAVEGPRGPLQAACSAGAWTVAAPGAGAARAAAARSMVGLEWATALVAAASFDISPWRLPG